MCFSVKWSRRALRTTPERCDGPTPWPAERIQVGPLAHSEPLPPGLDGGEPYCRVQLDPKGRGETMLYFVNRWPLQNRVPMSGEPTWARLRFPVPPGHRATVFSYAVAWDSLMGSHPERCADADLDPDTGECVRPYIADDEDWDDPVPPGLFVLWARPGDCAGWLITGPHGPLGEIGYSAPRTFEIEVPQTLQDVDELVVGVLAYHQHPGCAGGQQLWLQTARPVKVTVAWTGA